MNVYKKFELTTSNSITELRLSLDGPRRPAVERPVAKKAQNCDRDSYRLIERLIYTLRKERAPPIVGHSF